MAACDKNQHVDILIKQNCFSCIFNLGDFCAGYGIRTDNRNDTFGSPMEEMYEMFPDGCDHYKICLETHMKRKKQPLIEF